jgi:hypothetical protein
VLTDLSGMAARCSCDMAVRSNIDAVAMRIRREIAEQCIRLDMIAPWVSAVLVRWHQLDYLVLGQSDQDVLVLVLDCLVAEKTRIH